MKSSQETVVAVVCAVLLAVTSHAAAQSADYGIPTNIPGVTSAPEPPAGFDPVTASNRDLEGYGFPPRPDSQARPEAYARWEKAMSAAKQRIAPELRLGDKVHGPVRQLKEQNGTGTSPNWSGAAAVTNATSYNAPTSFRQVAAFYVVPVANQAFGTCSSSWDYSSTWVGIDGYGGNDVFQAGTSSDALCTGNVVGYYVAWFEWYPLPEMIIANLPVSPGDEMFVEVWPSSPTAGYAFLQNFTTNQYVSVFFTAPGGTELVGNSAEWVVERPGINGGQSTLMNYVSDYLSDCYAWTANDAEFTPGSASSTLLTMTDNKGLPISYPTLLGTTALWLQDEGSAR